MKKKTEEIVQLYNMSFLRVYIALSIDNCNGCVKFEFID